MSTDDATTPTQSPWRVGRVDLRSSVSANAWPVARLELEHDQHGRVTDIGSAPGAFDAAFVAASHILGVTPTLLGFDVKTEGRGPDGALAVTCVIEIELDGERHTGSNRGLDLIECSLHAWLDAVAKAGARP